MKAEKLNRCDNCQFNQKDSVENNPVWCRMHQDYFDKGDHCHRFTVKKKSRLFVF